MEQYDVILLPLLTGIGVFALVGLIYNLFEAYFEEQRKNRP